MLAKTHAADAAPPPDSMDLPSVPGLAYYSSQTQGRAASDVVHPERTHMPLASHAVEIKDARPIRDQLSLDTFGFVLVDHKSAIAHLRDRTQIFPAYGRELNEVILGITGADLAIPYKNGTFVRFSERVPAAARPEEASPLSSPAWFAHMDFTSKTLFDYANWAAEWENRPVPRFSRVALVHTWRAVSEPPQDTPLMLTDGRSPVPGHYTVMDNFIGDETIRGNVVETRIARYSPTDSWYYFSDMNENELIIFKGNDSLFGETQNVLHTAFQNSTVPNAVPRESIEARFIVYWN